MRRTDPENTSSISSRWIRLGLVALAVAGVWALLAYLPPGVGEWTLDAQIQIPPSGHSGRVGAVAISQTGVLASGDEAGGLRLWTEDGSGTVLQSDGDSIEALELTADGLRLIAGTGVGGLDVWDLQTGRRVRQAQVGDRAVSALAIGPGDLVAVATVAGELHLWDPHAGDPDELGIGAFGQPVTSLAFVPEGELVVASGSSVHFWSVEERAQLRRIELEDLAPTVLAIDSDGRYLAAGGAEKILIFDLASGASGSTLDLAGRSVLGLHFLADGTLVSAEHPGTLQHWNLRTGEVLRRSRWHSDRLTRLAFADGELVGGGADGIVRHWTLSDDAPPRLLGAPAISVKASHDGDWVATSHGSGVLGPGNIALRDRRSGLRERTLRVADWPATCLEFSPDDDWLGLWYVYGDVRTWNLDSGQVLAEPPPPGPPKCRAPHERRFSVSLLKQVRGPEVFLEDARTDLLISVADDYVLATDIPHRSLSDILWGRVGMAGVRNDGAIILGAIRPQVPLPLGLAFLLSLVFVPRALRWTAGSLRARLSQGRNIR